MNITITSNDRAFVTELLNLCHEYGDLTVSLQLDPVWLDNQPLDRKARLRAARQRADAYIAERDADLARRVAHDDRRASQAERMAWLSSIYANVMAVGCPYCQARPGETCHTPGNVLLPQPATHAARRGLWLRTEADDDVAAFDRRVTLDEM